MLVFGDVHIGRGLPHTSTDENGKDHRYEFMKNLLRKVLSGDKEFLFLGDITDKANQFDGKLFEDLYRTFEGKDIKVLLGNHDRSKDGSKHTSLIEALALSLPGVEVITGVEGFKPKTADTYVLGTSYYATDEEIKEAVINAARQHEQVIVFGHWYFWNELHQSGRKLKRFASKFDNVKWVLGHDHSPRKINDIGFYLGVMNPKVFGETQGRVMRLEGKEYSFLKYPTGETFIKGYLTEDEKDLPDIEEPERTYLKIYTDDPDKIPKIKDKYEDIGLRHFSMPLVQKEEIGQDITFEEHVNKTVDDHIIEAMEANDFDTNELMPTHQEVKEKTPLK